jgi:hypothetical protein
LASIRPGISLALNDFGPDEVPDVTPRPLDELVAWVDSANEHRDQARFPLVGAPTRFRDDPIARDVVLTLDRRTRRQVWKQDSLRHRFGAGGQGPRSWEQLSGLAGGRGH